MSSPDKAHLSVDPDSELIDQVTIGAANTPDRDAAAELLEEHAIGEDQPEIVGYSAYADAATRASLEEQGSLSSAPR
jgi:IS5 family transposase